MSILNSELRDLWNRLIDAVNRIRPESPTLPYDSGLDIIHSRLITDGGYDAYTVPVTPGEYLTQIAAYTRYLHAGSPNEDHPSEYVENHGYNTFREIVEMLENIGDVDIQCEHTGEKEYWWESWNDGYHSYYWRCVNCDYTYEDISYAQCNYVNGYCAQCGFKDPNYVIGGTCVKCSVGNVSSDAPYICDNCYYSYELECYVCPDCSIPLSGGVCNNPSCDNYTPGTSYEQCPVCNEYTYSNGYCSYCEDNIYGFSCPDHGTDDTHYIAGDTGSFTCNFGCQCVVEAGNVYVESSDYTTCSTCGRYLSEGEHNIASGYGAYCRNCDPTCGYMETLDTNEQIWHCYICGTGTSSWE